MRMHLTATAALKPLVWGSMVLCLACTSPMQSPAQKSQDTTARQPGESKDSLATDSAPRPLLEPYPVGVRTLEIVGANARKLPTEIWYPAQQSEGFEPAKYLNGIIPSNSGALRDAPALEGPWPLVVFSHGNGGVRDQSIFVAEWLAQHGYVVASPEHVGNSFWDMKSDQMAVMWLWRPQDIAAVIEAVSSPPASSWLSGLIDSQAVGVIGHSFGGYTSLALAGLAVQVPAALQKACEQPKSLRSRQQQLVCAEIDKLGDPPFRFAMEQVKVSVPLAHAGYGNQMLKPIGSEDMLAPVVMIGASGDTSTPMSQEAAPLFQAHAGPVAMVTIKGGSHYSFANICEVEAILPNTTLDAVGDICAPSASPTIEESFEIINIHTLAALDLFIRGDQQARAQFAPMDTKLVQVQSKGIYKAGGQP